MKKHLLFGLLLAALSGGAASAPDHRATYLGSFVWADDTVGGLSGLEVGADGQDFVVISDRGTRYDGRFQREGDQITGLSLASSAPILRRNGRR